MRKFFLDLRCNFGGAYVHLLVGGIQTVTKHLGLGDARISLGFN